MVELDLLRGVALLGILPMNIMAFAMPNAAYFNPTLYGDLTGANLWIWALTHLLAAEKFMTIFSMLFGAGILLMADRATASGRRAGALHIRRMFWLIVFGLMHAYLLWFGDVLVWYGLCGLLVFLLRGLRPVLLAGLGILSLAIASGFMLLGGLTLDLWPPEAYSAMLAELNPPPDAVAAEIAAYQGGWSMQMQYRVPAALEMHSSTFLSWALWRASGAMLLGMALFKAGILTGRATPRTYRILVLSGLLAGLPIVALGIRYNFAIDWDPMMSFLVGSQYNYWGSIVVALGWIGLVIPLCRLRAGSHNDTSPQARAACTVVRPVLIPVVAVGRMAFTNYILQTVLCTWIFYGHGLSLFGEVERTGQIAIVIAVWILQLIVSPLWLRRFRFGPLEWLWRALAYGRLPAWTHVNRA